MKARHYLLLRWLSSLFPTFRGNAVIAQFQQRDDLVIGNGAVQNNGDPMVFIHVVCREKPFRREKGTNHDGVAFYVHDVESFATWQAQLFRENAHHGGIPLLTGRMAEYCVAWTVCPKVFRLRSKGILYVLRDTSTLRVFSHFHPPGTLSSVPRILAAPPRWPHGQRISHSRGTALAQQCG